MSKDSLLEKVVRATYPRQILKQIAPPPKTSEEDIDDADTSVLETYLKKYQTVVQKTIKKHIERRIGKSFEQSKTIGSMY